MTQNNTLGGVQLN